MQEVISRHADLDSARKAAVQRITPIRNARYLLVSDAQTRVQKLRKGLLGFIEKQVLPVIDGLDDGEKVSRQLVESLSAGNSMQQEHLGVWMGTCGNLRDVLINLLEGVEVRKMTVETGKPVDFDRQEPFDTEPDPDLNTEDIKEVSRNGYEYSAGKEGKFLVLRPAQVIVVKN